jgi:methylthioribose-1-phosphate isomerase
MIPTITWVKGSIRIIDQRKLPNEFKFVVCRDLKTIWQAIRTLTVRGAPALGVAAAFAVLLGAEKFNGRNRKTFDRSMEKVCRYIGTSRPTAVNLFNALDRMRRILKNHPQESVVAIKALLKKEAFAIFQEDRMSCRRMGQYGARFIHPGNTVMTICNAGALATADFGTALGVLYTAKAQGKKFKVFACETRPLLQGARLTSWELMKERIDTTLICDNMAATVMKNSKIDLIVTGADRIASNGDTANKIGTYSLAVLAKHHGIPFYVAAPLSTFDLKIKSGKDIPIEERSREEVICIGRRCIAPKNVKVYNPAFDVTDHNLISAIVTEYGIIRPPFRKNIRKLLSGHASSK